MTQILCTTWWHSFGQEMELVNYRWIYLVYWSLWAEISWWFFFCSGDEFLLFFSGVLQNHAWMFQIVFKNIFHANGLGDFDMVIGLNWIKKHFWWRIAPLSKKTVQCRRTVQPSTDGMDFVNCVLNLTWDLPIYRWFIGDNNPFIGENIWK